ncbi:MAG: metalloregulator ArsR/SmtB family transcription factor [Defluviitaleaceae bacterium]|nr:metalloregulator ArsR/SmtB family transcription factor [Defluviitaleaceae bacterium]
MKYKIHYEPVYALECRYALESVINGTSIKDEMEESIARRNAESIRPSIEALFQRSISMEEYLKENVNLNLPGYEKTGAAMAEFLFKKWERFDSAPIDAIRAYNVMVNAGIENKAVAIIVDIDDNYMEKHIWGVKELEAGTPPPPVDDSRFFWLINNSVLGQEEKLRALKLYYEFESYRTYARVLLQHTEELLRAKISEHADDIKAHMDFAEENWLTDLAANLKKELDVEIDDDFSRYHFYPGVYQANAISLRDNLIEEPYITLGMEIMSLKKLYDSAETDNEKAAQFLRCLGDGTKLSILQLLKNESMYGGQLAEKLNCSSANISQHMSVLSNLGVIRYRRENNRMYFDVNKDVIHKYLDAAKGLFG